MAIYAGTDTEKKEIIPAGTYLARCYQLVELGTVTSEYLGKTKHLPKVRIGFELPTEKRVFTKEKGEQPFVVSTEFTLSLFDKAKLKGFLESWRGKKFTDEELKKFDITALLGAPCMIGIIHSEDGKYANISSVSTVPKGIAVPPAINPPFNLSYDNFSFEMYNTLPDFIKDKMKGTPEFIALTHPEETPNDEHPNGTYTNEQGQTADKLPADLEDTTPF